MIFVARMSSEYHTSFDIKFDKIDRVEFDFVASVYRASVRSTTTVGGHMWAIISTVVFDRNDCYSDAERNLLAIAKFLVG